MTIGKYTPREKPPQLRVDLESCLLWIDDEPLSIGEADLLAWSKFIDTNNELKGWNEGDRTPAEWCALGHTELSEFYEEHRSAKGPQEIYHNGSVNYDDSPIHWPETVKPEGQAMEMADLIIRALHWFARNKMDPNFCVALKMRYNLTRPYRHGNKIS